MSTSIVKCTNSRVLKAAISIVLNKFIFNVHFSVHFYFKRSQHYSIQSIQKRNRTRPNKSRTTSLKLTFTKEYD